MKVTTMVMEAYEAPKIEVFEVEVEKGFASSSCTESLGDTNNEIGW